MKRIAVLAVILSLLLCACGMPTEDVDETKLQIVCSDFPAYDFARAVAGDDAQIKLLIKPGAEVHSFEPTPKDMIRIQNCDLFIYNGGESEEWVEELTEDLPEHIRMMDCVETVEESDEGIYNTEDEEDEEEAELDEHVWTSPKNAAIICECICDALCDIDGDNAAKYRARLELYTRELIKLDIEIKAVVTAGENNTLVFADRFPMRYFTREYGLSYFAAFPGCSSETEPSAKTVAYLIDKVRDEKLPAVLYMEFSNEKMADTICEDTGCKKLPFYSAHTVTAQQFHDGVTYLDLMRINLNSLKEALG